MRARAGFLGGILVLLIGAGVAWLAYQAGLSQTAATAVGAGTAAAPVVVYGGGWGFGFFHVFGIIFGLIFLFIVARVVLGLLFWRGPRHWGGHGWGSGSDPSGRGPWGPMGFRGERIAELHRRLHEEEQAHTGGTPPATPPAGSTGPTA